MSLRLGPRQRNLAHMAEARPTATIRLATEADVPRIVELIHLGAAGMSPEEPGPPLAQGYYDGFAAIRAHPGVDAYVAELDGEVVATFQLAIIPNLSHRGRPVAQVESVHVAAEWRGHGIGEQLLRFAIAEARRHGCFRLQLTSNKSRTDAHRFYRRLGFEQSHEGMKLALD